MMKIELLFYIHYTSFLFSIFILSLEPPRTYGLVAALNDRDQSDLHNPHVYDSSDFLGHSSLSIKSMFTSFYEGIVGVIDDPDDQHIQQTHEFENEPQSLEKDSGKNVRKIFY